MSKRRRPPREMCDECGKAHAVTSNFYAVNPWRSESEFRPPVLRLFLCPACTTKEREDARSYQSWCLWQRFEPIQYYEIGSEGWIALECALRYLASGG